MSPTAAMKEEGGAAASVVHLRSSCTIKPARPTPNHRLGLSVLDHVMPFTHAPTVYFYRCSSSNSNDSTPFFSPDVMKNALSQALVKFYPLAGRLHPRSSGRLELDCNAMGALFVEAESDARVDDFGDVTPGPGLRKLVPSVDYTTDTGSWPLLLAQLTYLRCGGVCLGLGICHTLADGRAAMHFISTWAGIAREDHAQRPGRSVDVAPFFDRTVLCTRDSPPPAPAFEHPEFDPLPLLIGHDDAGELRTKETDVAMLKLSSKQVEKLRQEAPGYSRFLVVASHLWRTACRARRLHPDQMTKISFTVDWRNRLRPPLPEGYFGNASFPTFLSARSGELASEPVSHTARRGREAVEKMSDEYLRSMLHFLASQEDLGPYKRGSHTLECSRQQGFYGCPNISVTSWLGLPLYEADFGWGPPTHMGPADVGFEGKAFLMHSGEGDGAGLLIAMRLMEEHVKAFKEIFYEGLL